MGLLKLVIVDDEPILLEGLVKTYDWNGMGYEVVAERRAGVKDNTRKKTTRSADRHQDETDFRTYGNGRNQEREPGVSVRGIKCIQGF
mgnify:CR=1 FL=1